MIWSKGQKQTAGMKKKGFFSFLDFFWKNKKRRRGTKEYMSSQQIELLKSRLEEFMQQQQPFLKPGYSIKDMSNDLDIPSYQLSGFINRNIGMHFNDFLNRYRVNYCEKLMKTLNSKISLKELAYKCGFNNRNSFTTAFKKFTGQTPSYYARHH
jgi:AraC-like DNA-binding protein